MVNLFRKMAEIGAERQVGKGGMVCLRYRSPYALFISRQSSETRGDDDQGELPRRAVADWKAPANKEREKVLTTACR